MHLAHQAWDLAELSAAAASPSASAPRSRPTSSAATGPPGRSPVGRMGEWVAAIRAICARWQDGTAARLRGRAHPPHAHDPGVRPRAAPLRSARRSGWARSGPKMVALATAAGRRAAHPPVHLRPPPRPRSPSPASTDGLAAAGRPADDLTARRPGDRGLHVRPGQAGRPRRSPPAGWSASTAPPPPTSPSSRPRAAADLHPELRRLSREGRWDEMAALIDDDLLDAVVLRGDPATVAAAPAPSGYGDVPTGWRSARPAASPTRTWPRWSPRSVREAGPVIVRDASAADLPAITRHLQRRDRHLRRHLARRARHPRRPHGLVRAPGLHRHPVLVAAVDGDTVARATPRSASSGPRPATGPPSSTRSTSTPATGAAAWARPSSTR